MLCWKLSSCEFAGSLSTCSSSLSLHIESGPQLQTLSPPRTMQKKSFTEPIPPLLGPDEKLPTSHGIPIESPREQTMVASCQASKEVRTGSDNAGPGINLQPDVRAKVYQQPSHREDSVSRPNSKLTTYHVQRLESSSGKPLCEF